MTFNVVVEESIESTKFSQSNLTITHNQKSTNLCFAVSAVSLVRAESINIISKKAHKTQGEVRNLLKTAEFGHRQMLCPYLFCVYPRSLAGFAVNRNDEELVDVDRQFGNFRKAVERLAYPSILHDPGWKLILPLTELFQRFHMNPDDYKLEMTKVYHPKSKGYDAQRDTSFDDILKQKRTIIRRGFIYYIRYVIYHVTT